MAELTEFTTIIIADLTKNVVLLNDMVGLFGDTGDMSDHDPKFVEVINVVRKFEENFVFFNDKLALEVVGNDAREEFKGNEEVGNEAVENDLESKTENEEGNVMRKDEENEVEDSGLRRLFSVPKSKLHYP